MRKFISRAAATLALTVLTTATAWAETVKYIDAAGQEQTVTATVVTSDMTTLGTEGQTTWYVVSNYVNRNATVTIKGDVRLILSNDISMTVDANDNFGFILDGDLTIYGQSGNTGTLTVSGDDCGIYSNVNDMHDKIYDVTISGGTVTVTAKTQGYGIYCADLTISGGTVNASGNTGGTGLSADGTVNISGGTVTATGGNYGISAENTVTISGGNITASGTGDGGIVGFYGVTISGGTVTASGPFAFDTDEDEGGITLSGGTVIATGGYFGTVTVADGYVYTDGTAATYGMTGYSGTLSDAEKTAIAGKTLRPAAYTSYVEADGTQHNDVVAIPLTGGGTTTLAAGTYVASGNINYTGKLEFGNATIILADGATMNVGTSENRINGSGIIGWGALTIYGQTNGTGTLSVYVNGFCNSAIFASAITIHGGNITANANGNYAIGLNTADDGTVTINGGNVSATATGSTDNAVMGIYSGYININGGTVEVSGTDVGIFAHHEIAINGGNVEASSISTFEGDGPITLGWTNPTDRITTNSYSGTVSVATTGGHKLHNGSSFLGGTVSNLDDVNGKTLRPALSTTYIDADGSTHDATDAIVLDPDQSDLAAGTYAAYGNTHYNSGITLGGDATLILADGCHMRMGSSSNRIDGIGISGSANLTITSETLGDDMGALSVYNTGEYKHGIKAGALTINGGHVTANCYGLYAIALCAATGDVTINGGTVSAFSTLALQAHAIYAQGNFNYNGGDVTLQHGAGNDSYTIKANGRHYIFNWRNPDYDQITLGTTGLYAPAGATATFSKAMTDGTTAYSGDVTDLSPLVDVTLQPCAAVTFAKEGYATYYDSQYDATLPDGVKARVITADAGGTLTYQTIADGDLFEAVPAGTAVMLQTAASDAAQTMPLLLSGSGEPYIGPNLLHGSDTETATTGEGKHYKLSYNSGGTDIGWYWGAAAGAPFTSGAHKAWLVLPSAGARGFVGLPDWETGISRPTPNPSLNGGEWYTLDGRKLAGKPAKAGLYINNGRKVVIK